MKKSIYIYIISLIVLGFSFIIALEYQESGRMQLIAGMTIAFGILTNIVGYSLKNNVSK